MSDKIPQQIAAETLAEKRERHKPRSMQHKVWRAVHDPVKGWHAALVDCPFHASQVAHQKALDALRGGDGAAFINAASEALLARVRASLSGDSHDQQA